MRSISDISAWTGELPVVLVAPAADASARRLRLRSLVARVLRVPPEDILVSHGEGRGPRMVAPPGGGLHLSSAGRAGLAALAVGLNPLGVDLEAVEPGLEPPWNVLHPDERGWLASLAAGEREQAFTRLWAAKEAYLKALGIGLAREPSTFAGLPGPASGTMRIIDPEQPGASTTVATEWTLSGGREFAVALAELVG